jgi:uncharacterized protein
MSTAKLKKIVLISVGSLSLALGFLGAFLPVLPTTPFLLLSAYCYLHSSKRLYRWLINHPLLGSYIYNYLTYRAITRSTRYGALFFLWVTLIISMVVTANLQLSILLTAVGVGVTIHLFMLNTLDRDEFNRLVLVRKGQKELIR